MRFTKLLSPLAGIGILLTSAATPAWSSTVTVEVVCKSDGLSPADGSCAGKGGFVVNTAFESESYDDCLEKAALTEKLPPHFTPWSPPAGTAAAEDAKAEEAKALARRTNYCQGIYPNLNSAGTATVAWASKGDFFTKVAIAIGTEAECVKRLKAAAEIPLVAGEWKDDVAGFCKSKGAEPEAAEATIGNGKYRSRWVQEGGSWSTPWVAAHDTAFCGHGENCNCGGKDLCGKYDNGKSTTAWPFGCAAAAWTIRCESELNENAAKAPAEEEGIKFWIELKSAPEDPERKPCQRINAFKGEGTQCTEKAGTMCTMMRGNLISGGLQFLNLECKVVTPGK
ncbi:MAG: hypothetical protein EOP11_21130 [Proteobacteria bacterium]|nr:MAG: hypothetical protein EOP11_21130 [Pseudomonadota bacterium]